MYGSYCDTSGIEEQLKTVKAVLKALNVKFEKQTLLPSHISESIKKGLKEYESGQLKSLNDFKKSHFSQK